MKVLRIVFDIFAIIITLICPTFVGKQMLLLHKELFADMRESEENVK